MEVKQAKDNKIKELPLMVETFLVLTRFTNDILKEIKEQESKPFEPTECGFFITETTLKLLSKDPKLDILEFDLKTKYKTYLIRLFKKESKIWIQYKYTGKEHYKMLVDLIKIPSHRFGVELLRNLGLLSNEK